MSDFIQWVSHGVKRGRFEMGQRAVLAITVLGVVLALVAGLYLGLVSKTAVQGRRIQELQAELSRIRRENEHTAVEIAVESTIYRLFERASQMGLAPAELVEFIGVSGQ